MIAKPANTAEPIAEIIAARWSGRAYDASRAVSEAQITALCEAARWAPSCFGDEPWRFIIWDRFHDAESWQKAFDCLVEGNQAWAKNAPVLILAASVEHFSHNDKPNRWTGYDTGAASVSLCLQATQLGLMSHQMGGFDSNAMRETFAIPESVHLWSMNAIGYALPLEALGAEQREKELSPRKRRPLEQQFFHGGWQQSR
ncbi:nitroreductase [Methylophaga frappieri]|uniref:Nitroreductase n=1 Tax=Methylophaga frappieri (strain ATCC BAA-2434 / DSM 25690 / JAM7) TaxID=754477 RepID=I1YE72_METFJ|nr:nitroreductase family protein [Methylophaga frappieri]AFJ01215.1 nitroreductase [Methylophaga frappieri]